MDIQDMLDTYLKGLSEERSKFMVCLGDLMDAAEANPNGFVKLDGTLSLGSERSYRGYYNELAFAPSVTAMTNVECYEACRRATVDTYFGYKGGEYTYARDTPLWVADYGCCGRAIVDLKVVEGDIILTSKDVD